MKTFSRFGVQIPEILLPKGISLGTWSVIACDQYTQDREYWKKAAAAAEGKPSTLNLIYPEVYLNEADKEKRIESIQRTMGEYLKSGLFSAEEMAVYVERTTEYGRMRKGLVVAIDLDKYEWKPGSKAFIRATEATVPERIPPRMRIRNGAQLELPHIMLLANDKERALVEETGKIAKLDGEKAYDGELMLGGGKITGWKVKSDRAIKRISDALEKIKDENTDSDGNTFLFAVGDGNHSLATAKAVWDEHKKTLSDSEREASPVRFALVEIVNIYDEGLTFEPIHRVVFNHNPEKLISFTAEKLGGKMLGFDSAEKLAGFIGDKTAAGARFGFIRTKGGKTSFTALETEITDLAIAALQPALDEFIAGDSGKKEDIDYIHGTEDTVLLGKKENATAILLPPIAKDSFFQTIANRGVLPRKSFSMGEASEKRFYVEARRLF